jgi:type IV pilus assembly protein PilB
LGEILTGSGYVATGAMESALATQPAGTLIGEHLVRCGRITEDALYQALSLQQGLPVAKLDPRDVPQRVARALPQHVAREWRVVPFRIAGNSLFLAGPDLPTQEMNTALRQFTSLEIRFHLLTPTDFEKLSALLL